MTKKTAIICFAAVLSLSACVEPPKSPAEAAARSAAAYEYTARNCAGMGGGFNDAIAIRRQAEARYAKARELGATDLQIRQQQNTVNALANNAITMMGKQETCSKMVAEAAWNAS